MFLSTNFRSRQSRWIVLFIGLAACGDSERGCTTCPPVGTESAVVIDSTVMVLLSDSAQVAAGLLRFRSSGSAPRLVIGNVLVGAQGGGFLARVDSIRNSSNGEFIAYTKQAYLVDVVRDGSFGSIVAIGTGFDPAPGSVAGDRGSEVGSVRWGPSYVRQLLPGASFTDGKLSLNGVVLYADPLTTVRVSSGFIDFTPTVDLGVEIKGATLTEFHAVATGAIEYEVNLEALTQASITVSANAPLATFTRPFTAMMGPVPIVGELRLELVGVTEVTGKYRQRLFGGVRGNHSVAFGGRYTGGAWSNVWDPRTSFTSLPLGADRERELKVRFAVRPVLRVVLFRIGGPSLYGEPYMDIDARVNLSSGRWWRSATAGLDGGVDFRLSVPPFGVEITSYERRFEGPSALVSRDSGDLALDSALIVDRVPHVRRDSTLQLSLARFWESERVTFGPPARWASRKPSVLEVDSSGKVHARADSDSAYVVVQVSTDSGKILRDSVLVRIDGVLPIRLAAGGTHTCALSVEGRAFCWGAESTVGNGSRGHGRVLIPTEVTGGHVFAVISAGHDHTCALTPEGKAFCWGWGERGALGNGSPENVNVPTPVAGEHAFVSISSGYAHTCGVTSAGRVYCWGENYLGALGNGSMALVFAFSPIAVAGNILFSQVTSGYYHSCALTPEGTAYCWGMNGVEEQYGGGALGNGTTTSSPVPTRVLTDRAFSSITMGESHTCALTLAKEPYCWGVGVFGAVGLGEIHPPPNPGTNPAHSLVPAPVVGGLQLASISTKGALHTCAVTVTGMGYCWGYYAGLGSGNGESSSVPVPVTGGHTFLSISAGWRHTCASTSENKIYCWGNNEYGQLGTGASIYTITLVPTRVAGSVF